MPTGYRLYQILERAKYQSTIQSSCLSYCQHSSVHSSYMLLKTDCRLKADAVLAKDLLMNLCQGGHRHVQRGVLKERKQTGEIIKRGRKQVPKVQCCPFNRYLSNIQLVTPTLSTTDSIEKVLVSCVPSS